MIENICMLLHENVIEFEELEGFSDSLIETIALITKKSH